MQGGWTKWTVCGEAKHGQTAREEKERVSFMPCSSDHSCQERNQLSQDTQACREPGFPTKRSSAGQE